MEQQINNNSGIIDAWNKLNKVNNKISLLETLIENQYDIKSSKLKDILTSCSVSNSDKFINAIVSKDDHALELREQYKLKNAYENYILNEIKILKLSEPSLCIAFLKEYSLKKDNKRYSWEDIAKEMGFSVAQCRRYYDEYKGRTPDDNSWVVDVVNIK